MAATDWLTDYCETNYETTDCEVISLIQALCQEDDSCRIWWRGLCFPQYPYPEFVWVYWTMDEPGCNVCDD